MRSADVLKGLAEMRQSYKDQGFSYNNEQQAQYDKLLKLRRDRVSEFHKSGRVTVSVFKVLYNICTQHSVLVYVMSKLIV